MPDETNPPAAAPPLDLLRDWQVRRLARTYRDYLANPRFAPSCKFFIEDIYAARDFSRRNRAFRQLHEALQPFAPGAITRPLALAIELHELTENLDAQLASVLVEQLGMSGELTVPLYAEAYRRCNNYDTRARQILMIVDLGMRVEALVNLPFSGAVLRVARSTADGSGQGDVMAFLERGYSAFKRMHGARAFLNVIREREMGILDRIYSADPDPFGFGASR